MGKSIPVKCANYAAGCTWTGDVVDYPAHRNACECRGLENSLAELREENESLRAVIQTYEHDIQRLRLQVERTGSDGGHVTQQRFNQVQNIQSCAFRQATGYRMRDIDNATTASIDSSSSLKLWLSSGERTLKLSQLIARHLENKSPHINNSRIYSCVESFYRDQW